MYPNCCNSVCTGGQDAGPLLLSRATRSQKELLSTWTETFDVDLISLALLLDKEYSVLVLSDSVFNKEGVASIVL